MNTISTAEKKLILSRLLPFYGALLTENQRRMVQLFADEDLSLGEIAEQYGVSRQSVHDAVTKAEKQMAELEKKLCIFLGLLAGSRIDNCGLADILETKAVRV